MLELDVATLNLVETVLDRAWGHMEAASGRIPEETDAAVVEAEDLMEAAGIERRVAERVMTVWLIARPRRQVAQLLADYDPVMWRRSPPPPGAFPLPGG